MRAHEVVIRRPERVSRTRRGFYGALTVAAWAGFVWLLQPVFTLLLWGVGGRIAYEEVLRQARAVEPAIVFAIAMLSMAAGLGLVTWAELNRKRFRGRRRRTIPALANPKEMAEEVGFSQRAHRILREARIATVTFGDDGLPFSVTNNQSDPPGSPD